MPLTAEERLEKLEKYSTDFAEEMAKALEDRDEQISSHGAAKAETAKVIEKLNTRFDEISAEITGIKDQVSEVEAQSQRPDFTDSEDDLPSLGEMICDSEQVKRMVSENRNSCDRIPVKGGSLGPYMQQLRRSVGIKQLTTGAGSGGATVRPGRMSEWFALPQLPTVRVRNIIPFVGTEDSAVEYVREVAFHNILTRLTVAIVAATTNPITVENAQGFYAGMTFTLAFGTGDEEDVTVAAGGVNLDDNEITLTAVTANAHAIGVEAVGSRFIATQETQLKPEAGISFELLTVNAQTLAHWLPASRQILADSRRMEAFVRGRLLEGLDLQEEWQLLYGDGTAPQINGIISDPDIQTYNWSAGPSGDTKIDAVRRAMTLIFLTNIAPDGIILHDLDWEDIETTKGSDGHYIWAKVQQLGTTILWRLPVAVTSSINEGDFLCGAFRMGSQGFDREEATFRFSEHHADYFTHNMVALLVEERISHAIMLPQLYCHGSFDSAPE